MGTYEEPFSAYQYRYIQRELSHVTLAERARVRELPPYAATKATILVRQVNAAE